MRQDQTRNITHTAAIRSDVGEYGIVAVFNPRIDQGNFIAKKYERINKTFHALIRTNRNLKRVPYKMYPIGNFHCTTIWSKIHCIFIFPARISLNDVFSGSDDKKSDGNDFPDGWKSMIIIPGNK
jgi:hypothetical protein